MRKRWLAMMLALVMVLLAGCGGNDNKDSSEDFRKDENNLSSKKDENSGEGGKTTESDENDEQENEPLTIGKLENGVYTNTYLGIGCVLDSDWTYYSAEELQDLQGIVIESMDGTVIGEAVADQTQIIDMMAENVDELFSVNITLTKLSKSDQRLYKEMTNDEVIDGVLSMQELMAEAFVSSGIEMDKMEKVTVPFLGENRAAVLISAHIGEIEYYCIQLYFYGAQEYGAVLTLCSYVENRTEELLDLFFALE